jgi:DNA adenine methylase
VKPPFPYFGGKTAIAGRIAALLPPHEHYVEPFAGSLAVLLAKPPSRAETVNDLDGDLMNFWRVLRERPAELERACMLTPHSRAEFEQAWRPADTELEAARRTWVRITQGRGLSTADNGGWRHFQKPDGRRRVHAMCHPELIGLTAERIADVTLECRPALEVIGAYGRHEGVLIYADPPYLGSTRNGSGRYGSEMAGDGDHRDLAIALRESRSAVVLSGYHSPLHDDLYRDWHRREIPALARNGTGDRTRVEVLWSNRPFLQRTLFDPDTVTA